MECHHCHQQYKYKTQEGLDRHIAEQHPSPEVVAERRQQARENRLNREREELNENQAKYQKRYWLFMGYLPEEYSQAQVFGSMDQIYGSCDSVEEIAPSLPESVYDVLIFDSVDKCFIIPEDVGVNRTAYDW